MRWIKRRDAEPGVRYDLLTGQDTFSPRFLSEDEHMTSTRLEDAWASAWCLLLAAPRVVAGIMHDYLVMCGVLANLVLIYLIVWVR